MEDGYANYSFKQYVLTVVTMVNCLPEKIVKLAELRSPTVK